LGGHKARPLHFLISLTLYIVVSILTIHFIFFNTFLQNFTILTII
jgi:hypothetical protein